MENRVCIVGIGSVESEPSVVGLSHKELLFRSTRKALDDAGLERKDIGGAITSSYDFLEGRSLSNQYSLDSVGGVMKPCDLRLGDDGIYALFAGYMEVMADPSKFVVVASVQKASDMGGSEGSTYPKLVLASMEPVFSRPVCSSIPNVMALESVLAAMEARAFMERTGLKEKELARVAVKNLNNRNSGAKKGGPDLGEVLKSEVLSWPIRRSMKAKETDAACTLILASERKVRSMSKPMVFVRGIGWCSDQSHLAFRQAGVARETQGAACQAYRMAGIQHPDKEIDLGEVSDWYAHRELMHCEALGFCNAQEMGSRIADGVFERNGAIPINVSGGLLGRGNAIGTSGLLRVAQVALQIRGQAKGYQVPGVEVGLAHSWSGIPVACAGVAVLSKW